MNDYESQARAWLENVDAPPSRLDTGQIVQVGRARARRRRYLAVGGATAMVVLAAAAALPVAVDVWPDGTGGSSPLDPPVAGSQPPLPALDCEITELELPDDHPVRGTPDPSDVWIRAMDPTGRFVLGNWVSGEVTGTDDPPVVLVWDIEEGTVAYLPAGQSGQDVNAHGTVVGADPQGEGESPWIYRDGEVDTLPLPAGYQTGRAEFVHESGDVVGAAWGANGDSVVVVWPADDLARPEILAGSEGLNPVAAGITDDGAVVASDDQGPFFWDADRVHHRLPLPEGATGGHIGAVRGNWGVGGATFPASGASLPPTPMSDGDGQAVIGVPVRWDLAAGAAELIDVGTYPDVGAAVAVSTAGDVVTSVTDTADPIVVRDGRPYTLPVPVPVEDGHPQPEAVSEDGMVFAGTVRTSAPDGSPVAQPTVWHCR
jgi:hypothetical protein